ncbi:MAG: C40 family peptidase [Clostridium sp.]|nr:C40 family peptidase [Clostridium sp.]
MTGEEAVEIAKEVSTRIATVNTQTLKVRKDPGTEAGVLGLVPMGDILVVLEETDSWVKVDVEEGLGWVSADYVVLSREFVSAESKAEEAIRLEKEAEERRVARAAAAAAAAKNQPKTPAAPTSYIPVGGGSDMGNAVAEYAVQFVGNPYVYGGSSLTNGADCSGFVMSVYANFGVSLPHSSAADRKQGYAVDGIENAQPGDLICYSGHVALYIGDGQIVHASTKKTGIIISKVNYKKILAIRRIF